MKNKNKKVVFGLTSLFFAVVTVSLYIWGPELCEIISVPDFASKVEMAKMIGPIAAIFSGFLAFKNDLR